jgi:hypothetical protein
MKDKTLELVGIVFVAAWLGALAGAFAAVVSTFIRGARS